MAITEWPAGKQAITGPQSHWFQPILSNDDSGLLVFVPYTQQYGSGTPPWTVTLTAIGIDASGKASTPIPLATYATGFDFQVTSAAMPDDQTAVFWSVANGTYPASHAVDVDARLLDASGNPVSHSTTLLSGIDDLEQFRVGTVATNGSPTLIAYSTYDTATQQEQVNIAGFNPDGSAVPADSRVLGSFTSYGGYSAFGFGTLTPSTGTTPSFIYLRNILVGTTTDLAYQTISPTGAPTGALTQVTLSYDAGSTNQSLVTWVWSRLDGPAGGNNLVTAAIIDDTPDAAGGLGEALDVRVLNTNGGQAADDVVQLGLPDRDLAITQTAGGGFVIAYVDGGVTWLRQYNNTGDLLNEQSVFPPDNPESPSLSTLPDGRLAVVYPAGGGSTIDEDIFTLGAGPISYRVDAGVTRTIAMQAGDNLTVKAGGTVTSLTAALGAEGINVLSGGLIKTAVLNGGTEQVFGGATVGSTTLYGLAAQFVVTGGVANGTIVTLNAQLSVGGVTNNAIVKAGGFETIGQPGRDYGARLNKGGTQWVDGVATTTTIAGGDQVIFAGGQAIQAVLMAGDQDVDGGAAVDTTINGGTQDIENGSSASGTIVNAGGTMEVDAGGVAYGATINAGGIVQLAPGGRLSLSTAAAPVTINGGLLAATGGGLPAALVSGPIVASGTGAAVEVKGGTLELDGSVTGPIALKADAGSTLTLHHGAASSVAFSFAGVATLKLDDTASFSGSIASLAAGDVVDLTATSYSAGFETVFRETATGGALQLIDTAHKSAVVATLTMLGSYGTGVFTLANDGSGGTALGFANTPALGIQAGDTVTTAIPETVAVVDRYNADHSLYVEDRITQASTGSYTFHFQNGSFFAGKSFAAFDNVTNAAGLLLSQTLYDANGNSTQLTTFNANGTVYQQAAISRPVAGEILYHSDAGSFFTGKPYSAFDNLVTTGGTLLDQVLTNRDGSHTFIVPGSGLTLAALKNDTFNVTGQAETTRFNATGFGADAFNGYKAGDIFSFSTAIFANYQTLSQHLSGTNSAVVTDNAGDTLTLAGVAKSAVTAGMFKFA